MTVGSVRGNDKFEMPVRVTHAGLAFDPAGCSAVEGKALPTRFIDLSVGGHVRLKPALTLIVG